MTRLFLGVSVQRQVFWRGCFSFRILRWLLGHCPFPSCGPTNCVRTSILPLDEVVNDFVRLLASSSADRAGSRVQDFFDFELLLIVDEIGRRRGWDFLIREGQQDVRGKELLVEAQGESSSAVGASAYKLPPRPYQ